MVSIPVLETVETSPVEWEDYTATSRALVATAVAFLAYAALHYFQHPVMGLPGSLGIAGSVWILFFLIGGVILKAITALVDAWYEWSLWW